VLLSGGYTDTAVAGTAYFDDVVISPNTPTALAAAANGENVAIAVASTGVGAWTDIGTPDTIIPDVIDGGTGSTRLTFTADYKSGQSGQSISIRFRVGATNSNELTSTDNNYQTDLITLTVPDVVTASITIQMQGNAPGSGSADGRVDGADTTIEYIP
jgi:hypothetical protein